MASARCAVLLLVSLLPYVTSQANVTFRINPGAWWSLPAQRSVRPAFVTLVSAMVLALIACPPSALAEFALHAMCMTLPVLIPACLSLAGDVTLPPIWKKQFGDSWR